MENKRVTAIAVVMAIAFGGICHYGYGQYKELQAAHKEIAAKNSQMDDYASEDLPPTRENSQELAKAADTMDGLLAELRADVEQYAKACQAQVKDVSPARFQKDVNDMTAKIAAYAHEKGCALSPDAASLGLSEYKTASAPERDAPYLNFLLHATDGVVRHVIDSGAPAIKRVYCAPLPESEITARKPSAFFPLEVEITFTARRGTQIDPAKADSLSVLPQVINALTGDKKRFYIITGMAVKTAGNLPMVDPYRAPSAAAVGDSLTGAEQAAPAEPVAKLITGKAEEEVNVSLSLQALYFTTDKL